MTLADIIAALSGQARPRPDLITPGSTGALENARPYTFAGRVQNANQPATLGSIMSRLPMGEMESGGMAMQAIPGATLAGIAYHGSPFKFDKFDKARIGTGEGAAAYGHGLYFAENPATAESYKTGLSALMKPEITLEGAPIKPTSQIEKYAIGRVRNELAGGRRTLQEAIDKVASEAKDLRGANDPYYVAQETGIAKFLEGLKKEKLSVDKPGALYKVDIPDEHIGKMLDWDKPLGEQPHIKAAYQKASGGLELRGDFNAMTGAQLYKQLEGILGKERASNALQQLGIPGIKYLDQGSRGTGKGTSNFVVFDPAYIKSTERLKD